LLRYRIHLEQREYLRTGPTPTWVKSTVDAWTAAEAITHDRVFRAINKAGYVWGDGMSPKVALTHPRRELLAHLRHLGPVVLSGGVPP
jgi:hypothetical protein